MRVMSRKPPAARRSSAACSSARSLASAHQRRRGEVRHVADDGDDLVVAVGRQGHHLGAELGDHAATRPKVRPSVCGGGCRAPTRRRRTSTPSAPSSPSSSLPAIGWPPTKRGSSNASAIAALDAADVGDDAGGLGQRPLDLIGDRQHGHGDERDRGLGVEPGGVDRTHLRAPVRAVAGSTSSPLTCQPRSRRPSAIEPPIRPSPITLATRPRVGQIRGHVTGADRTGASVRRPPLISALRSPVDSSRQSPGRSERSLIGPMRVRTSRSTGCPTASHIRRTWRLRPSWIVIRSTPGAAATPAPAAVDAVVELDAVAQAGGARLRRRGRRRPRRDTPSRRRGSGGRCGWPARRRW